MLTRFQFAWGLKYITSAHTGDFWDSDRLAEYLDLVRSANYDYQFTTRQSDNLDRMAPSNKTGMP